jgi:membrane-bound acyltransferase YfiQ involved in biofilm formation
MMIKKIWTLFFEPLKAFANRNLAEKVSTYFNKNKWMTYIIALIFTLIIIFLGYTISGIFPE